MVTPLARLLASVLVAACAVDDPDVVLDPGADEAPEVEPAAPDDGADLPPTAAIAVCGGSVQAAINAAPQGSTLTLCAGTYKERLVINNKRIILRGASKATVILDAEGLGRAIAISNTTGTGVTVRDMTIKNGRTTGPGGGIGCSASKLVIRDLDVIASRADGGGGGLAASGCALDVVRARFEANDGRSEYGGGARVTASSGRIDRSAFVGNKAGKGGGLAIEEGSVELVDSEILENTASVRGGGLLHASNAAVRGNLIDGNDASWIGGGVYVDQHAATFEDNTISNSTSVNDGGGMYIHQGKTKLNDNVFRANRADDDGGGLRAFESELSMMRNVLEDNVAADGGGGVRFSHVYSNLRDNVVRGNRSIIGGGIELDNDSSTIRGGVVSGNTASIGAGIAISKVPFVGGLVEDVEIVDNEATSKGGGLYVVDNFQPITMRRLTVRDNTAVSGAGLYVAGTHFTLTNSVFDGNVASGDGGAIAHGVGTACSGSPCWPAAPTGDVDFLTVYGNEAGSGSALWAGAAGLSVENSIFQANGGVAVDLDGGIPVPQWRYNDGRVMTYDDMPDPTGTNGNIIGNPRFVAPDAGDFTLGNLSAAFNKGDPTKLDRDGTRADMGRFGGPAS